MLRRCLPGSRFVGEKGIYISSLYIFPYFLLPTSKFRVYSIRLGTEARTMRLIPTSKFIGIRPHWRRIQGLRARGGGDSFSAVEILGFRM